MTCIVGLVENDKIIIGGDSAGISGWSLTLRSDPKVFRNGPFLIGYTSSFRMGQLLRFKFTPPEHEDGLDDFEYLVTAFVDELRSCFKDGGYSKVSSNEETGGTFLVGYRGNLYSIQNDFQVAQSLHNYAAAGCGEDIALGAMFASAGLGIDPEFRIGMALAAAEQFSTGVRSPFVIEELAV